MLVQTIPFNVLIAVELFYAHLDGREREQLSGNGRFFDALSNQAQVPIVSWNADYVISSVGFYVLLVCFRFSVDCDVAIHFPNQLLL